MQGLYPPGSTVKPMTALALLGAGVDPEERVYCNGGYQLGNRSSAAIGGHGPMNLHTAIARELQHLFLRHGPPARHRGDRADSARKLGLGAGISNCPCPSQRFGTVPDPRVEAAPVRSGLGPVGHAQHRDRPGLCAGQPAAAGGDGGADRLGPRAHAALCSIGQAKPAQAAAASTADHLAVDPRRAWTSVVNGHGTAGRSRLPLEGIRLARQDRHRAGPPHLRRARAAGSSVPWK